MGHMLSAPVTAKESGDGAAPDKGIAWGFSCMQGWRVNMEDAHLAIGSLEGNGWGDTALFGVMDGHGGEQVARFCQVHLPEAIALGSCKDVKTALTNAYHRMDEMLSDPACLEELRSLSSSYHVSPLDRKAWAPHPDRIGCTANTVCIRQNMIIVANAGDSRAVLCRRGKAVNLSEDHKPNLPSERERINKAGGSVERQQAGHTVQFRVNGNLNLSRSIGDLEYKQNWSLPPCEQMICATPDVLVWNREAADEFLVIGCDGIWEVMESQEVIDFVRERLAHYRMIAGHDSCLSLSNIMEDLLDSCVSPDLHQTGGLGGDNMTAVLVVLNYGAVMAGQATQYAALDDAAIAPHGLCSCKVR
eukprot:gnl/TRDRNA2_/TRDRNA2_185187_c0_seq1.p1 gnl/TRDRNA2_/TRDRNA2_185187_c0~~gnl/TRDRNA2_/TRDRNA2_185187_c0_seq1.p1  ORF type:complete len:360 (-),score=58.57 gnl/TRDRNA2_/TRDRNA2_185187_c0_seq1:92-1171(-)